MEFWVNYNRGISPQLLAGGTHIPSHLLYITFTHYVRTWEGEGGWQKWINQAHPAISHIYKDTFIINTQHSGVT